jgi:hypothetical protein
MKLGRSTCEERPVHQIAHGVRGYSPMAEKVVNARIDRNHGIKDARLRVDVELNQNLGFLVGHQLAQPAKGCLTVSFCALISLKVG